LKIGALEVGDCVYASTLRLKFISFRFINICC
jgi:hypothetical protein